MVIFTMPPPDSPITSMLAISACAFCMFACMAWACFIRLPILPFMGPSSVACARLRELDHFTGRTVSGSTVAPKRSRRPLHARVGLEGPPRLGEFLLGGAPLRLRRRLGARRRRLELEAHGLAEVARQRLRELLLLRGGAHQLVARIERQAHHCALAADEGAVAGELARGAGQLELAHDLRPRDRVPAGAAAAAAARPARRRGCGRRQPRAGAARAARGGARSAPCAPRRRARPPGRNASMRSSVISKPLRGSGASARSRRPMIAVW